MGALQRPTLPPSTQPCAHNQGRPWNPSGVSGEANSFQIIPWQHFKPHRDSVPATKNIQKNFMAALLGENTSQAQTVSSRDLEKSWGKYFPASERTRMRQKYSRDSPRCERLVKITECWGQGPRGSSSMSSRVSHMECLSAGRPQTRL